MKYNPSVVSKYGIATAAQLAKGGKSGYQSGVTLRQTETHAPDGGAIVDYPKGWRFLPPATKEQHEILKKNPRVAEAMRNLHNRPQGALPKGSTTQKVHNQNIARYEASQHKIIENAHYALVIAPQIKAQEEAIARKEEEERLAIATLKMRVQELEKLTPTPTPAVTSSLPIIPIIIIAVIVGFFLLRRRA